METLHNPSTPVSEVRWCPTAQSLDTLLANPEGLPARLKVAGVPPNAGLALEKGAILEVLGVRTLYCAQGEVHAQTDNRDKLTRFGYMQPVNIPLNIPTKVRRMDRPEFVFPYIKDLKRHFPKKVRVSLDPRKDSNTLVLVDHGEVLELDRVEGEDILVAIVKGKEIKFPMNYRGDFEELPEDRVYEFEEVVLRHLCPQWVSFIGGQDIKDSLAPYTEYKGEIKLNYMFQQRQLICRTADASISGNHEVICMPVSYRKDPIQISFSKPIGAELHRPNILDFRLATSKAEIDAVNNDCTVKVSPDTLTLLSMQHCSNKSSVPKISTADSALSETCHKTACTLNTTLPREQYPSNYSITSKTKPDVPPRSRVPGKPVNILKQPASPKLSQEIGANSGMSTWPRGLSKTSPPPLPPAPRKKPPAPLPPKRTDKESVSEDLPKHPVGLTKSVLMSNVPLESPTKVTPLPLYSNEHKSHTFPRDATGALNVIRGEHTGHKDNGVQEHMKVFNDIPNPDTVGYTSMAGTSSDGYMPMTDTGTDGYMPTSGTGTDGYMPMSDTTTDGYLPMSKVLAEGDVGASGDGAAGRLPDAQTIANRGLPWRPTALPQSTSGRTLTSNQQHHTEDVPSSNPSLPSMCDSPDPQREHASPFCQKDAPVSPPVPQARMRKESSSGEKRNAVYGHAFDVSKRSNKDPLSEKRTPPEIPKKPSIGPKIPPRKPPLPVRPPTLGAGRSNPNLLDSCVGSNESCAVSSRPTTPVKAQEDSNGSRTVSSQSNTPARAPEEASPMGRHESGDGATDMHLEGAASTREIPSRLDKLSVRGLANAMRLLKLDRVADICEDNLVDGLVFQDLKEQDLTDEPFNLTGLALRKVINFRDGWRPRLQ